MAHVVEVDVSRYDPAALQEDLPAGRWDHLRVRAREALGEKTLWHVNSTAAGGGVAEMLQPMIGLARSVGLSARWLVIDAPSSFFDITKRVDNGVSGIAGDGGQLGAEEERVYADVSRELVSGLARYVCPGDCMMLHDPQTAGLCEGLRGLGATVVWRAQRIRRAQCIHRARMGLSRSASARSGWSRRDDGHVPAAGYSEAMIYKLFADKVDLFLSVLRERVPAVNILTRTAHTPGDANNLEGRLTATVTQITAFYRQTFAIGASLFWDAELLERHRSSVMTQGAGPALLPAAVTRFLTLEQRNGSIAAGAPINGAASSIAGACYSRAFLEQFYGPEHPQEPMADFTASVVASVLPALITAQRDF